MKKKGVAGLSVITIALAVIMDIMIWFSAILFQKQDLAFKFVVGGAAAIGTFLGCVAIGPLSLGACAAGGAIAGGSGFVGFGGLDLVMGSDSPVQDQVDAVGDAVGTGSYLGQILLLPYSGSEPVDERLQEYLYCKSYTSSCSIDESVLKDRIDKVVGKKSYRFTASVGGTEEVSISSGGSFGRGPAVNQVLVPLPGGKRGEIRLVVEGSPGGVVWEDD